MSHSRSNTPRSLPRPHTHVSARLSLLVAAVAVLFSVSAGQPAAGSEPPDVDAPDYSSAVPAGAPMFFVPNVGQAPADVIYEARSLGRLIQFTRDGLRSNGASIEIGDAQASHVSAVDRRQGVVNLILGDDPTAWRTGVPTYGGLLYEDVRPGVDVAFEAGARGLTATALASDAGDLSGLSWRLTDAPGADNNADHDPDRDADHGADRDSDLNADRDSGQVADGDRMIGFAPALDAAQTSTGSGERSVTVLLDVVFASYLGGSRDDSAADVALDASGSPIVVGTTGSSNFPTKDPIQEDIGSGSLTDGFVTKLDPSGTALVWSTYLGGNRDDHATDVALDSSGNVVVVGYTGSQNFPTQDPIQEDLGGGDFDAFVAVLSIDGSQLEFGTYLGGRASDFGYSVTLGPDGPTSGIETIYVAGGTDSSDFPTVNAFQSRYGSSSDAFVTALAADRSGYLFSTYLGANSPETAYGIDVDGTGAAHVTGYVDGPGFPLENPFQRNYRGDSDVFVTKFAPGGETLVYSSYLGGRDRDTGYALKLDLAGRAVVAGQTASRDFPPVEAYQQALKGDSDVFIARVSGDGGTLEYSTYFGGTSTESGQDLEIDVQGRMHLTGWSFSTNFPVQDPVQDRPRGLNDAIVSTFSADGQKLLFSTLYGGAREDQGQGLAAAADGSVVFVGFTDSADFPTGDAAYQPDFAGQGDAFVVRLQTGGTPETPVPTTAVPTATSSPSATPTATTPGPPATDTPTPTPVTRTPSPTATDEPPTSTATPTGDVEVSIFAPFADK